MPFNSKRGVRLETSHNSEADIIGCSKVIKRRAKYLESCSTVASKFIQKQQGGVHKKGEEFRNKQPQESLILIYKYNLNNDMTILKICPQNSL